MIIFDDFLFGSAGEVVIKLLAHLHTLTPPPSPHTHTHTHTHTQDQVYSGLLRFNYYPKGKSGRAMSHDLQLTSHMTCTDVLPELRRHLVPHLNGSVGARGPGSIILRQGGSKYQLVILVTAFLHKNEHEKIKQFPPKILFNLFMQFYLCLLKLQVLIANEASFLVCTMAQILYIYISGRTSLP